MGDGPPVMAEAASAKLDPQTWVNAHGDALFRFALVRVRNREIAEELVQETFVAALVGRDKYSGAASERTWMVGILKFKVIDHFRRRRRDAETAGNLEGDEALDPMFRKDGHWKEGPAQWDVDASILLERKEFWEIFDDCVRGLPERVGQAFVLRVMDESDAEKVCQALAITPTNLWTLLHRARGRLRRCLEVKWFANPRKER